MNIHKHRKENADTAERRKLIIILLVTTVLIFIISYAVNRLYTFSCFSHNGKRAIMIGTYLLEIVYSFMVAKLSGIIWEDMGILPKLYRRYLFLLIPGVLIQLLRICLGKCTLLTGASDLILYLLVAVAEEILFRGLVLTLLLKITHSNKCAILIQAVIFGLMHYYNASYGTLSSCFGAMLIGAIFASIKVFLPDESIDKESQESDPFRGMGLPSVILLHWVMNMCLP